MTLRTSETSVIHIDSRLLRTNGAKPGEAKEMNAEDNEVFNKICALLEPFNTKKVALTKQTDITAELEIDSVAVLDLIMEVEDEYNLSFPMNEISEIRTIGDLADAIARHTAEG